MFGFNNCCRCCCSPSFCLSFDPCKLQCLLKMAITRINIKQQKLKLKSRQTMTTLMLHQSNNNQKTTAISTTTNNNNNHNHNDIRSRMLIESLIRDQNIIDVLCRLSMICDYLLQNRIDDSIQGIDKKCPPDELIINSICTLIYCSKWLSQSIGVEIQELHGIRKQFKRKYGTKFIKKAINNTDGVVSYEDIISKLHNITNIDPSLVDEYMDIIIFTTTTSQKKQEDHRFRNKHDDDQGNRNTKTNIQSKMTSISYRRNYNEDTTESSSSSSSLTASLSSSYSSTSMPNNNNNNNNNKKNHHTTTATTTTKKKTFGPTTTTTTSDGNDKNGQRHLYQDEDDDISTMMNQNLIISNGKDIHSRGDNNNNSLSMLAPTLPYRIFTPNPNLVIAFDVRTKNPIYVLERLKLVVNVDYATNNNNNNMTQQPHHHHQRPPFFEELSLPKMYRSKLQDYFCSGYDRGHMAPAADFHLLSESQYKDTFTLCNACPQIHSMNISIWLKLENYCRKIAKQQQQQQQEQVGKAIATETYVVTGPLWLPLTFLQSTTHESLSSSKTLQQQQHRYDFLAIGGGRSSGETTGTTTTIMPIHVPTHFFKVIIVVLDGRMIRKFACFVMPNTEIKQQQEKNNNRSSLKDYIVKWTDLEAMSGLQLFPTLTTSKGWKQYADMLTEKQQQHLQKQRRSHNNFDKMMEPTTKKAIMVADNNNKQLYRLEHLPVP